MKSCAICGESKPQEQFNRDQSRPDGLTRECRECNKERARRWYAQNRARKQAASLAYKATHANRPATEKPARVQTRPARRKEERKPRPEPEPLTDYQLVRFTASEWLHCLLRGQAVGMTGAEYVRHLVQRDHSADSDA